MSKMDCRRLSKNFAFMARKLQHLDNDNDILDTGKAVLEHHFDNHQHCGAWCRRKQYLADQENDEDNVDDNTKKEEA